MKYLAQFRSKRFSNEWTDWTQLGPTMNTNEVDEFLTEIRGTEQTQFRVLVVPIEWDNVIPNL